MLLAVVLRLWAVLTPGFHHPDAIYQYLEPAHRLLTNQGVVTWEWREGIRSWLIPALLAGPLMLGEALNSSGELPLILPRVVTAIASLGIVWAGWTIGKQHSRTTGLLAAFVMAIWFEIVFFAAETLAEPMAVAAILPAAAFLNAPRPSLRSIAMAGALLGFAALARPHYAPAAATLVIVAWWPEMNLSRASMVRWATLLGGAIVVAAVSAAIDASQGLIPFAWIVGNFQQNIVHGVSARYGTYPVLSYIASFMQVWRWWSIPVVFGVLLGWRQAPALLAAAAVTLIIHSLIPHKEYRFVLLVMTMLVLLAALGWGELITRAHYRWGGNRGRLIAIAIFASWGIASAALSRGDLAPTAIRFNTPGWKTFAFLRRDPAVCGVALVEPSNFVNLPGAVGLRYGVPISMFWTGDPLSGADRPWAVARRWDRTYNRIVTVSRGAIHVPARFDVTHCEQSANGRMCVLARPGGCVGETLSPYRINDVLTRMGS